MRPDGITGSSRFGADVIQVFENEAAFQRPANWNVWSGIAFAHHPDQLEPNEATETELRAVSTRGLPQIVLGTPLAKAGQELYQTTNVLMPFSQKRQQAQPETEPLLDSAPAPSTPASIPTMTPTPAPSPTPTPTSSPAGQSARINGRKPIEKHICMRWLTLRRIWGQGSVRRLYRIATAWNIILNLTGSLLAGAKWFCPVPTLAAAFVAGLWRNHSKLEARARDSQTFRITFVIEILVANGGIESLDMRGLHPISMSMPMPMPMLRPCAPHNNVENCFLYQFHTLRKQFDFIASSWLHVQLLKSLRLLSAPPVCHRPPLFLCLCQAPAPCPNSNISYVASRPCELCVAKNIFAHVFVSAFVSRSFRFRLWVLGNSFQLILHKVLYMPFSVVLYPKPITIDLQRVFLFWIGLRYVATGASSSDLIQFWNNKNIFICCFVFDLYVSSIPKISNSVPISRKKNNQKWTWILIGPHK